MQTLSLLWHGVLAGQEFWEEITGDPNFYKKLITLIENEVIQAKAIEYGKVWDRAINRYAVEFSKDFCTTDGAIDWKKLVEFNSGKNPPAKTKNK